MTINTQKLRDLIRQACPLPWMLATSNSWRRIVDPYHVPVCSPCNQPDGHPDLAFPGGAEGPTATLLIEAANALPELLDALDAQTAEIAAQARHANFLNAEIARLRSRIAELRVAVRGLLDALPSATTHPAIKRAKDALRETCHD